MIHLLTHRPSREELVALLRRHPARPLLPPLGDSRWAAAWANPLLAVLRDEFVRRADAEATTPPPALTDELYRDFALTGRRLAFENLYYERRRRLARAAVSLLVDHDASREAAFLACLEGVFREESWALPAHVANPSGRDRLMIDLFAAETANLLGECLDVFGAIIPVALQTGIRHRLRETMFLNFLRAPFYWASATGNWNAVCHQGVLGAALAVEDDAELLADLLLKAAEGLPYFLDGYGDDGGCTEGPAYWVYGFGWFSVLNEQLETRTGGELSLFADDAKIRRIAAYGPAMCLLGQKLVNFADCSQSAVVRPALLAYLGHRLDEPACRLQARENYAWLATRPFDFNGQRADLFYLLRLFLFCPAPEPTGRPAALKPDVFLPDLAVWVTRGRDHAGHVWELAAKGGHNDEHHNHNDLGSFLLNIDGVPLITEIGAPEYTRDFFRLETRYDFIATRGLGHSSPVIHGQEQAAGAAHVARVLEASLGAEVVRFAADLSLAYPAEAGCRRLVRTLTLEKSGGRLLWTDDFDLDRAGAVESALITGAEDVRIESAQVAVISRDGLVLELSARGDCRWDRVERHDYRNHQGGPASVRRLVLQPDFPVANFRLEVLATLRERPASA